MVDLYRCILMRGRVGEEFDATISGMSSHGFYSSFDEPFVDPNGASGDRYAAFPLFGDALGPPARATL